MNHEIQLINSIIDTGDISEALENNVDDLFSDHKDLWQYVLTFNQNYGRLPSKTIIKEHFKDFEFFDSSSAPLKYYIDEAIEQSLSRNIRVALHDAIKMLQTSGPHAALGYLNANSHKMMRLTGALKDTNLSAEWEERVKLFRERFNSDEKILGIPSGIRTVDYNYGGWKNGDFIILLGWTSSGKSWLARLFAVNAWRAGYTPLIISLEMNREQEGYRFDTILNHGEVFKNSELVFGRNLDPDAYEKWAKETFSGSHPIHLVTSDGIDSANEQMVQAKIDQYKPDMVILDYHGLFEYSGSAGTETEKTKELSKQFKRMAVRNNIPIIDICAVTMQDGQGERAPELSEVAWAKQLAFDADLVLAIHRPSNSQIFEVVSRKVRSGNLFAFYLEWDLDSGRWKETFDEI